MNWRSGRNSGADRDELKNNGADVKELVAKLGTGNAPLLFGSKELNRNNAAVLKEYLETLR